MTAVTGRVLVVGPSKPGDMAWFLALAYQRMGWQVARFDDRAYIGRGLKGVVGTAVQVLERDHRVTNRSRTLGALVRERARGCDHVVTVKGEYFLPEDVQAVAERTPFLNWHPDHPAITQSYAGIGHYSVFCPKDSWTTDRLRNMGFRNVVTLPHASDPVVLGGELADPAKPSFSVVGSSYPYRRHWVDQARGVGLVANLWGSTVSGDEPDLNVCRRQALGAAQGVALRTGCFTLNTHHPYDIAGGNQRVFDAAAAGAPQLTEQLPETVRHFKPGTEIATFEDAEDFQAKVRQLSADSGLRQRLARNSHERLRDEHTYEHRVRTILSLL